MELIPKGDSIQALRIRRFVIAVGSYAMWLVLIIYCQYQGFIRLSPFETAFAFIIFGLINLGFYLLIRTGLNKKFADPSLTFPQMIVGATGAMLAIYFTDRIREVMLLIYFVTVLFGVFRFNLRQYIAFTLFSVGGYGLVILLLYKNHPEAINLQIELLQFIVFAVVLTWFSVVGSYISSLRNRISATNRELNNALKTIEELAIYDDLTQAYNRRQMYKELRREKSLADRSRIPLTVLMLDLDHFKRVNDTFGHLKGDEVLRRLIQEIRNELRDTDTLARYGGEEFLVIMSNTDIAGAKDCAARILSCAERLTYPGFPESFQMTISIGLTVYRPVESIDDMISRADAALYRAKKNGRNRIEVEYPKEEDVLC